MAFRLNGDQDGARQRLLLHEGRYVLGAAPDADLRLPAPTISRHHAEIEVGPTRLWVRDLESSNGTRVDGHRARGVVEVAPGQHIGFGELAFIVERVEDGDEEIGAKMSVQDEVEPDPERATETLAPVTLERLAFEQIPRLLQAIRQGTTRTEFARRLGEALWQSLPLSRLTLTDERSEGFLFDAGKAAQGDLTGSAGGLRIVFRFGSTVDPRHERRLIALSDALLAMVEEQHDGPDDGNSENADLPDPPPLDPDVLHIYRRAARAARSGIAVLLRGESGTGKELLARFLHDRGGEPERPFVAVNCAALASDLLEAELFGIEKGAATGVDARPGCFELAHGGTLFLDEVGDMAEATQARILRVIQEGEVTRVGGSRRIPARARLVSATNRNLDSMIAEGTFRLDLLYRIAGWEVTLPPLRERPADLTNLALHFLARYCAEQNVKVRGISRRALELMSNYHWPGNVRELQQEMHRVSVFLADGDVLSGDDLAPSIREAGRNSTSCETLEDHLARFERKLFKQSLMRHAGNVSRAAESLGIARSTMYRRMAQIGLHAPDHALGDAAE